MRFYVRTSSDAAGLIACVLAKILFSFFFFIFSFSTHLIQSDVNPTEPAGMVKVIGSSCAHVNEPQSSLMELQ